MSETHIGLGTRLRRLIELLDGDLEAVYADVAPGYRPRFTPVMKALRDGPRTIKAIATISGVSHSAASQTISRMVKEGWLSHAAGEDARERIIFLDDKGRRLLPQLEQQWLRTDLAAQALEAEIGAPLADILAEAIGALERRPFRDRVR